MPHGVDFDLLFGPAYKGIPLATALACEYARRGRDLPLAFNRKEAKAHGEGGSLIGAPLEGRRVLIVDDVITAGTAIREALAIIADGGGIAGRDRDRARSAGSASTGRDCPTFGGADGRRRTRPAGDRRRHPVRPACVRRRKRGTCRRIASACSPTARATAATSH